MGQKMRCFWVSRFLTLTLIFGLTAEFSHADGLVCESLFSDKKVGLSNDSSSPSTPLESPSAIKQAAEEAYEHQLFYNNGRLPFSAETLVKIWRLKRPFMQAEFYDAIGSDPQRIQEIYESWYGKPSQKFPLLKQALPARLLALSLDPGIMGRVNEFIAFSKTYLAGHPTASTIELREAFSEKLGTKTYYRGLSLNPLEADRWQVAGIQPRQLSYQPYVPEVYPPHPAPRMPKTRLEAEMRQWADFLIKGPKIDMLQRIRESGQNRMSQSVTDFFEVGVYAAKRFGRPGLEAFVFELHIPVLEVTEALRVTSNFGHVAFESMGKTFYMDQPGVEGFVLGEIDPNWIHAVTPFGPVGEGQRFTEQP
jgi:hypothetical protein